MRLLRRKYSAGVIDQHRVMRDLGLTTQGQVLDALGLADLPLPCVPPKQLKRMVADALKVIGK